MGKLWAAPLGQEGLNEVIAREASQDVAAPQCVVAAKGWNHIQNTKDPLSMLDDPNARATSFGFKCHGCKSLEAVIGNRGPSGRFADRP